MRDCFGSSSADAPVLLILTRPTLVLSKHSAYFSPTTMGLYRVREELPSLYALTLIHDLVLSLALYASWHLDDISWGCYSSFFHFVLLFFSLLRPSVPLPFVLLLLDLVSLSLTQVRKVTHPLTFPTVPSTSSLWPWLPCPSSLGRPSMLIAWVRLATGISFCTPHTLGGPPPSSSLLHSSMSPNFSSSWPSFLLAVTVLPFVSKQSSSTSFSINEWQLHLLHSPWIYARFVSTVLPRINPSLYLLRK